MAIDKLKKSYELEKIAIENTSQEKITRISLEARNDSTNKEIEILNDLIRRDFDELTSIKNNIIEPISIKAEKAVNNVLIGVGIGGFTAICILAKLIYDNWNIAEPILYLLSFIPPFVLYFIAVATTKNISLKLIKATFITRVINKENKKNIYFLNKITELEKYIVENTRKLEKLKQSLIYN